MEEESSRKSSKSRIGCGTGCLVVVILGVIAVGIGYYMIKDTIDAFEQTDKAIKELEEKHGSIYDYIPTPDGSIAAQRIEAFLKIQDSMKPVRQDLVKFIDKLEKDVKQVDQEDPSFFEAMGIVKKGVGLVPQLAKYQNSRIALLMDAGMGLGEYKYLYVIAYYSYLGNQPGDGPDFHYFIGKHHGKRSRRPGNQPSAESEEEKQPSLRRAKNELRYVVARMVNELMFPMLQRQRKTFEEKSDSGENTWLKTLDTEIEAMEKQIDHLPWQDGLPDVIKASLEPFKERLQQSYPKAVNIIEISQVNSMGVVFDR